MTKEEKVQYWTDLSDEDLRAADTLLSGKHYLYVAYTCHQSLEKIFKACYTHLLDGTPPFIHRLIRLAELAGFDNRLSDEQKAFIDFVEPFNIKARYPDYKYEVSQRLTHSVCTSLIEQTKNLQQWTKEKIL
jgi:HEPN domain-containing protein